MKSIAFFNNKGGVGKTTLLCNTAAFLAKRRGKKVCVIDADPQCNATQYFFTEDQVEEIYDQNRFTIENFLYPISTGDQLPEKISTLNSLEFGCSILPGDPRLALLEDNLAADWSAALGGNIRAIRTNLAFVDLFNKLKDFDYVLIDVSPSLGAINRSILLATDYFVSPMSIDIFSLRAFANISEWINDWERDLEKAVQNIRDRSRGPQIPHNRTKFLGYVTQQYLAKREGGVRRPVGAYEEIRRKIDEGIDKAGLGTHIKGESYELGTVPYLFSLVPMSQNANKPVFDLKSSDGVVGAHFQKVRDAQDIFELVADEILRRTDG